MKWNLLGSYLIFTLFIGGLLVGCASAAKDDPSAISQPAEQRPERLDPAGDADRLHAEEERVEPAERFVGVELHHVVHPRTKVMFWICRLFSRLICGVVNCVWWRRLPSSAILWPRWAVRLLI